MPILPASTNDRYRGSLAASRFLLAAAILTVVPGCIHAFFADGGAGSIAGIDLGPSAAIIISVFAWAGATQIVHGLAMLAVALWYRTLVPLFLLLALVERSIMTVNWWLLKPPVTDAAAHRPPEVYATLVLLPLLAFFLVRSLPRSGSAATTQ